MASGAAPSSLGVCQPGTTSKAAPPCAVSSSPGASQPRTTSRDAPSVLRVVHLCELQNCSCERPAWPLVWVPGEEKPRCFECAKPVQELSRLEPLDRAAARWRLFCLGLCGAPAVVHMSLREVEPRSVASESPPHPDTENAAAFREIAAAVTRTRGDIETHHQHSEGAALHAAVLAGKEALAEGKSKEEVAAVIESAGAKVCGLEQWRCSGSVLIAEAHVIGTRGLRFGTLQEQADLEYIATGH